MSENREELIHLIADMPDDQVDVLLTDARRLSAVAPRGEWPPRFFGIGESEDGRTDNARRVDDILAGGFGGPPHMIICDTGPIFAAADRKDDDHHACIELFTGLRLAGRRLLLPQTVLAEVGYMLEAKVGTFAEVAFLESVAAGNFQLVDLTAVDVARVAELVGRYDDLPLGTTDASVIALAERFDVDEIATLDHRHFRVVRPNHIDAFTLLPEPSS